MAPITSWAQLLAFIGTTVERADLDFKAMIGSPPDSFELAKDIAALANAFGGSIVVGAATEKKFLCTGLTGIPLGDAVKLSSAFEHAAGEQCRPRATLDCAVVRLPSNPTQVVLVINVAASAAAPIGIKDPKTDAWWFPLRTTSHTVWLSPDQFGAYESMTARRSGALLSSIPLSEREQIIIREERSHQRPRSHASTLGGDPRHRGQLVGCLVDVDYRANVAQFSLGLNEGESRFDFRVPLDWVATAWRDTSLNRWFVLVDCVFHRRADAANWTVERPEL